MREYLYLSVLDDGERFEFVSLDTLSHPLDFLDEIENVRKDHREAVHIHGLNHNEIYGCFGPSGEVSLFEDVVLKEACGLRTSPRPTIQFERSILEGDEIKASCVEILRSRARGSTDAKIGICRWRDEDDQFSLFLLMNGEAYSSQECCQLAIEQLANAWLEQEEPFLLCRQVMTNGFMLRGVRGKRIISPHFNAQAHRWELLLEGARRLSLSGDPLYVGAQTDSAIVGSWTEPDVESIILDPLNGFGVSFEPYEVVEDWLKALLYCFALSFYREEWSGATLKTVYFEFLKLLKERFRFEEVSGVELPVGEDLYLKTFREMARRCADFLRGIEESELTRRFASETPSRVYQLKALAPLLARHGVLDIRNSREKPFDRVRFGELLSACDAGNAAEKGRALEDVAACMLEALPAWCLAGRRVRADDCEIDLCYVNRSLDQKAWDLGCMLLVECKNRVELTGISVLRNLSFVMDAKGAKAGMVISASRFSKVVRDQVRRLALQGKIIFLVDGACLESIAKGAHPDVVLSEQYASLMNRIEDDFGLLC